MTIIDLNGTWEVKAVDAYGMLPPEKQGVKQWMRATVPGTVHTDLMANQVLRDERE
jgi:hypothetical protein